MCVLYVCFWVYKMLSMSYILYNGWKIREARAAVEIRFLICRNGYVLYSVLYILSLYFLNILINLALVR